VTTLPCPTCGPTTATDGYCDTCGLLVGAPAGSPAGVAGDPATGTSSDGSTSPAGTDCPNCGTPGDSKQRFCEDCGYDRKTGKVPDLAAAAPVTTSSAASSVTSSTTPAAEWTATVTADRVYFDANDIDGVEFPVAYPEKQFVLTGTQMLIGRRSASKGVNPEMDLSAPPVDPGISHSHALLTRDTTGIWLLSDPGSTNGTYVNSNPTALTPGQTLKLTDGDQIHVGAWTTITVHAPA
jgi:hypothetical protein